MRIKNIIMSGFRSYRDQPFPEELSPNHNVVVGRNGSGKSNFFAAVQFVLSEKFADLRPAERKELFHVGAGRPGFSIYVEIIFDNSAGRLVLPNAPEQREVTIRRTLGLKQDEYRVNDRKYSAAEVRQLLESAGISASNPYYIVEQGKIQSTAQMRPEELYQLLKDVAGTKVYESRRSESERILAETDGKQRQVEDQVKQLDERLVQLEAETSELRLFQTADRTRKAVEYAVYTSEVDQSRVGLEKLDAEWTTRVKSAELQRAELDELEAEGRAAGVQSTLCDTRIVELEGERKSQESKRAEAASRRAVATLKADEVAGISGRDAKERTALVSEAKQLEGELRKASVECEKRKNDADTARAAAKSVVDEFASVESRLTALQAKRGRKNQFKTKAERDDWIAKEIHQNEGAVKSTKDEAAKLEQELQSMDRRLVQEREHIMALLKEAAASEADTKKRAATVVEANLKNRDVLAEKRRGLWQRQNEADAAVRRCRDGRDKARHAYDRSVRFDLRQGLQSLERCLQEMNSPNITNAVYGRVVDLMHVHRDAQTAAELTAGNALLNVVVESFDVSQKILAHFNRNKMPGRITFSPLDTCNPPTRLLPTTEFANPLIDHIEVKDARTMPVFQELFGRTLLTQSLEAAAEAVKQHDCDAITRDGDQFNRKGGITGGFVEVRSKISSVRDLTSSNVEYEAALAEQQKVRDLIAHIELDVTTAAQAVDDANSQDAAQMDTARQCRHDARVAEERVARLSAQVEQTKVTIQALGDTEGQSRTTINALRTELSEAFDVRLSLAEVAELEQLDARIGSLRATATAKQSAAMQMSTDQQLRDDTHRYLEERLHKVQDRIAAISAATELSTGAETAALKHLVATLDAEVQATDERLGRIDSEIDTLLRDRRKHEETANAARRKALEINRAGQSQKDDADRAHNQRALLLQKKEEAQAKVRRLGVVPPEAMEYRSLPHTRLMAKMKSANAELKKFEHVNKKAIDQYRSLTEARADLQVKREELTKEHDSVVQLMGHLEIQKVEAIQRTFKQVEYYFGEVFKGLVRAEEAHGELRLVEGVSQDEDATQSSRADLYAGVQVEVNFGGPGGHVAELGQLSGGQKSLVALALIFAIQRSDPAPFYLFDEIDAALDDAYRSNVAAMIREQSETSQFLTATFKTEMLDVADKVFGIFYANRVSTIQRIDKEEGARILRQAAMDERKRQREESEAPQHIG